MTGAVEAQVARHYSQDGLEEIAIQALAASGAKLAPSDLAPVDEFHIGGRQATAEFAGQFSVMPGMSLFDIGAVSAPPRAISRISAAAGSRAST
jgi:hypothetical protein